jgi:PEGA domain
MSLPQDSVFLPETTDSPEDPFGLFPSEIQKPPEIQRAAAERQNAVPVPPKRAVATAGRRFFVLTIASLVRLFAALIAASRRVVRFAAASCAWVVSAVRRLRLPRWRLSAGRLPTWRLPRLQLSRWHLPTLRLPTLRLPALRLSTWQFPAWHLPSRRVPTSHLPGSRLPAWRLPAWRLPAWHLSAWRIDTWRTRMAAVGSEVRPFVRQIAARTPITAVTVSAFVCGVIAGGSAVWLSGASRHAGAQSTPSQQTPLAVSRVEASPIAPVGAAVAKTPVVQGGKSQAAAAIPSAGNRRPFRGSLVVNSRPSGARVFLNGRSVGRTPLVLKNQPAGSRAVRVDLDGYEPWSWAVQVVADTETRLRAELKMQRPAAQP